MTLKELLLGIAVLALGCGIVAAVCLLIAPAHGIELSIMGHSAGQGYQNLSFVGDALNVSILQNESFRNWSILVEAIE